MDDDELEAVQLESNHTIEIDQFVPFTQIDKRYYDQPYYIVPNDTVGVEAFAVIREAMEGKGVAALGRVVMTKRERVIALEPFGKGLLGTTLHYDYEVRKPDEYFDDIPDVKIANDMLKLAQHIVESKEGEFQPDLFVDHYEEAVIDVIRKKQAHVPVRRAPKASAPKNVINLMDALRRSVAGRRQARQGRRRARSGLRARARCCCRSPARRRKPRKRASPRRDARPADATTKARADAQPRRRILRRVLHRAEGRVVVGWYCRAQRLAKSLPPSHEKRRAKFGPPSQSSVVSVIRRRRRTKRSGRSPRR